MQGPTAEIINIFLVSTAIILTLVILVAFFMVTYQRRIMAQKFRIQEVETQAQRQRLAAVVETQEEERIRIARDLHDDIGAKLSAVKLSLHLLDRRLAKGEEGINLQEPADLITQVIASIRDISHDLIPPPLEMLGLAMALEGLAEATAQLSNAAFTCTTTGESRRFPIRTELTLYRVVQELVTNSLKHAHATQRTLLITFTPNALHITFQDNGKGFDQTQVRNEAKGLGLRSMETRIEALGGTLAIMTNPNQGFHAKLMLQL